MTDLAGPSEGTPTEDVSGDVSESRVVGRRALMFGAAAAGAGVAATTIGWAQPASADTGGSVVLGNDNTATATTGISTTSGIGLNASTSDQNGVGVQGTNTASGGGDGVSGTSTAGSGVSGSSTSGWGLSGLSNSNYGVNGFSYENSGILGQAGINGSHGVFGQNDAAGRAGVYGNDNSPNNGPGSPGGWGVYGFTLLGIGVQGHTEAPGSYGVYGEDKGSPGGVGTYGVSDHGVGVEGLSDTFVGVQGTTQSGTAVKAVASTTGKALVASSTSGTAVSATATSGTAVSGSSTSGYGVVARGALAPIRLIPSGSAGAPTSGAHALGELYVDSAGRLYRCIVAGSPGVWIPVYSTVPLPTPIRIIDTINSQGGITGPLKPLTTYTSTKLTGATGIPAQAVAVVGTIVLSAPTSTGKLPGIGYLNVFPGGVARPDVANVYADSSNEIASGATVVLGTGAHAGTLSVYATISCHALVFVAAYII